MRYPASEKLEIIRLVEQSYLPIKRTLDKLDIPRTLNLALQAWGCDQAQVIHKPRLLSDNGSSYVSGELAGVG